MLVSKSFLYGSRELTVYGGKDKIVDVKNCNLRGNSDEYKNSFCL